MQGRFFTEWWMLEHADKEVVKADTDVPVLYCSMLDILCLYYMSIFNFKVSCHFLNIKYLIIHYCFTNKNIRGF